ncbi:MAG: hypothetical protein K9J79_12000 [Desulfobacteraceae bacterium]|nr:hypothetical protein [Desulfobacteraceae bacterium]
MPDKLNKQELIETAREKLEALISQTGIFQDWSIRKETRGENSPDFIMELFGNNLIQLLMVETRNSGEPRLAREAANSLLVKMQNWSHAAPIFVAPYISEDAAELCREKNINYMDLAGNCRIALDNLFINSRGNPNPYKNKRRLKSFAKPKSARILRVLLNHPKRRWQTQELAREAGVSLGLVANVKKILKDREWIDGKKQKIILARPLELLSQWIADATPAPNDRVYHFAADLDFIGAENAIIEYCRDNGIQCAFTGLTGAVHMASGIDYYRRVQAHIYGDFDVSGKELGFEKTDSGNANVTLIRPVDPGVFYGARQVQPAARLRYCRPSEKTVKTIEAEIQVPMHIVCPVQIYFDLLVTLGKDQKEAEKVLKQVIEPSW